MERLKQLSGPLSMLLIGMIFFGVGVGLVWHESRYTREGVAAEATVTFKRIAQRSNNSSSGSRTSYTHEIVYAFELGGDKLIGDGQISEETWQGLSPGDKVAIVYVRSEPSVNRPAEDGGMIFPWIFVGVGGILTLVGGGLAVRYNSALNSRAKATSTDTAI